MERSKKAQSILIADGDALVRYALADYLRDCGYRVFEAQTTDDAIVALSEPATQIDAILCDVSINGTKSAFELRTWVRENRPALKTVLAGNIVAAAAAAADLCEEGPELGRPYEPQSVVNYIKRLLGASG